MNTTDLLKGCGVAVVTPFNEKSEVDFPALGKIIEHLIRDGASYLVVLGTTGETATLNQQERQQVFHFFSEKCKGKIPLVAGLGGNNTGELVKTFTQFNFEGYVAILSVTPYYNKPGQRGLLAHYGALSEVSPLPMRTGRSLLWH